MRKRSRRYRSHLPALARGTSIALALLGTVGLGDSAVAITFTKVADADTPIPNGTGTFNNFTRSSFDGTNVAFGGSGPPVPGDSAPQRGIYTWDGTSIDVVADRKSPLPGGSSTFDVFDIPSIDGGQVAFRAKDTAGGFGVYTNAGGPLVAVADSSTPIPGGTGNFDSFGGFLTLDDGDVAFVGVDASEQEGIYRSTGGTLSVVANMSTPIPGASGTFGSFSTARHPSLDQGSIAFYGTASGVGVGLYTDAPGSLTLVAGESTAIPGGTGLFERFGSPVLHDGEVAFRGRNASEDGIYVTSGSVLELVADKGSAIPGGSGTFTSFNNNPSLNAGVVAFLGLGSGGHQGLYVEIGDALFKIIDNSDTLDGKSIEFLSFWSEGLVGDQLLFGVGFTGGSQGLYLATIPEPPVVMLTVLGLASLSIAGRAGRLGEHQGRA